MLIEVGQEVSPAVQSCQLSRQALRGWSVLRVCSADEHLARRQKLCALPARQGYKVTSGHFPADSLGRTLRACVICFIWRLDGTPAHCSALNSKRLATCLLTPSRGKLLARSFGVGLTGNVRAGASAGSKFTFFMTSTLYVQKVFVRLLGFLFRSSLILAAVRLSPLPLPQFSQRSSS